MLGSNLKLKNVGMIKTVYGLNSNMCLRGHMLTLAMILIVTTSESDLSKVFLMSAHSC